jgi:hypothetical protein
MKTIMNEMKVLKNILNIVLVEQLRIQMFYLPSSKGVS